MRSKEIAEKVTNKMTQKGLTQKIVREYVRRLGGTFKATGFGDFKIRFGSEESEYFGSDLADCIGTARVYRGGHENIGSAEEYLVLEIGESAAKGIR